MRPGKWLARSKKFFFSCRDGALYCREWRAGSSEANFLAARAVADHHSARLRPELVLRLPLILNTNLQDLFQ